jgi:hypothetical protein
MQSEIPYAIIVDKIFRNLHFRLIISDLTALLLLNISHWANMFKVTLKFSEIQGFEKSKDSITIGKQESFKKLSNLMNFNK